MKNKKGFTLVEMLVVIGILAFALPALITIVLGIVRQQFKINALKEVKRQGDLVLNSMKVNIKNYGQTAYNGVPSPLSNPTNGICETTGTGSAPNGMYFLDINGNYFGFRLQGTTLNINENSTFVQGGNLTTNKVRVENLQLSCERTASFSSPVISVSYDVTYNTTSTRPQDNATFRYQTKIKIKNF